MELQSLEGNQESTNITPGVEIKHQVTSLSCSSSRLLEITLFQACDCQYSQMGAFTLSIEATIRTCLEDATVARVC